MFLSLIDKVHLPVLVLEMHFLLKTLSLEFLYPLRMLVDHLHQLWALGPPLCDHLGVSHQSSTIEGL